MAGMPNYRKFGFSIQSLAIIAGILAGAFINDKMGGNWSLWHKFAVRIACVAVAVGVASVMGIASHLPARRRNGILK